MNLANGMRFAPALNLMADRGAIFRIIAKHFWAMSMERCFLELPQG
jgi:hypothetical protein